MHVGGTFNIVKVSELSIYSSIMNTMGIFIIHGSSSGQLA